MKQGQLLLIIPLFLLFISASCKKTNPPENGAVKAALYDYTGLDGCSWVFKLESNEVLEPTNLGQFDFNLTDGKKIWVKYHPAVDQASICMVGQVVDVDAIWNR